MKKIPLLIAIMCMASLSFAQSKIDAAFAWDNNIVYFIKGNKVAKYDNAQNDVISTVSLSEAFAGIPFNSVDAALNYGNGKIYFFSGSQYARYDQESRQIDPNYPKNIAKYWEGVEFDRIDAAITWSNGKTYFFRQGNYTRYDNSDEMTDDNYPKRITDQTWPGVNFSSIDASINLPGGKTYFFKDDQYLRFDEQNDRADSGYPKELSKWGGLIEALGGSSPKPNPKPNPNPEPTTKGIDFFKGSWGEALSKAKASGQLIFVDAYTTWCGPCKRMSANVFPDANVGKLYNKSFINVKMDMERGEGPTFARKYEISAYPSLLFIDGNGKLIKKALGAHEVEAFLELGKKLSKYNGGGNNNGGNGGNGGNNNGGNNKSYGSFKVNKKSIDLSPYKADSPNSVLADFKLKKGYNGINFLAIQKEHDAIIFKINSNGDRVGSPIVLTKYWLSDIYPMEDGSLGVIAGKSINNTYLGDYPNTLHFIKISSSGAVSSPKHIFGGEGHEAGKSWFDGRSEGRITYNGTNFGIYFEVQKNWADAGEKDDIHNGDMFVVTDKNGNKDESKSHFWTASHSNTVQTAAMANGEFWTMTIGDAHPFGLQVYNRDEDKNFVVWPPKEDFVSYADCESANAAGLLRYMTEDNGELIAFMGTVDHPNIGWKTKVDPLFLKFDKQGNITKKKYLRVSSDIDESNISVEKIGENYLVAYGPGNVYEDNWKAGSFEINIIDSNANNILAPTKIDYPFGTNSQMIPLSNKKFVWCNAAYDGVSSLDYYEITFD